MCWQATTWRTVFYGRGWSRATPEQSPSTGLDRAVTCSVSGPEPGYIATALMFSAMARFVREERTKLPVQGGVYTPGALVGAGGAPAVMQLVDSLRAVGIKFEVDEPPTAITPWDPTLTTRPYDDTWQVDEPPTAITPKPWSAASES